MARQNSQDNCGAIKCLAKKMHLEIFITKFAVWIPPILSNREPYLLLPWEMRGHMEAGGTQLSLPCTPAEYQSWSQGVEEGSTAVSDRLISKHPA